MVNFNMSRIENSVKPSEFIKAVDSTIWQNLGGTFFLFIIFAVLFGSMSRFQVQERMVASIFTTMLASFGLYLLGMIHIVVCYILIVLFIISIVMLFVTNS